MPTRTHSTDRPHPLGEDRALTMIKYTILYCLTHTHTHSLSLSLHIHIQAGITYFHAYIYIYVDG